MALACTHRLDRLLRRTERGVGSPDRANEHASRLSSGDVLAAGEAQEAGSDDGCARFLTNLSTKGLFPGLVALRATSGQLPASSVATDHDDIANARDTYAFRAVSLAFRRHARRVPRHQDLVIADADDLPGAEIGMPALALRHGSDPSAVR
jgi:hypothetical protein